MFKVKNCFLLIPLIDKYSESSVPVFYYLFFFLLLSFVFLFFVWQNILLCVQQFIAKLSFDLYNTSLWMHRRKDLVIYAEKKERKKKQIGTTPNSTLINSALMFLPFIHIWEMLYCLRTISKRGISRNSHLPLRQTPFPLISTIPPVTFKNATSKCYQ